MTSLKTLMLWTCNLNGQLPTTQGNVRLTTLTLSLSLSRLYIFYYTLKSFFFLNYNVINLM